MEKDGHVFMSVSIIRAACDIVNLSFPSTEQATQLVRGSQVVYVRSTSTDFVRLAADGANTEVCDYLIVEEADSNALASQSPSADPLYVSLLSLRDTLVFFFLQPSQYSWEGPCHCRRKEGLQ